VPDRHEYELYLAVEDIDHTQTKPRSPQTSLDALQMDLDAWLTAYNERRPDQGRWCYGKTPMQTFVDCIPKEKLLAT